MKPIPKRTTPLQKSVRTLEGWLVLGANVALVTVPIVTSAIPATLAVKLGVVINGTYVVARTVLKLVAVLSPYTGAPTTPTVELGFAPVGADPQALPVNVTSQAQPEPALEDMNDSEVPPEISDEIEYNATPDEIESPGHAELTPEEAANPPRPDKGAAEEGQS